MIKNKLVSQNRADIENILSDWLSSHIFSEDATYIKKIERDNCRITIIIAEEFYLRINSTLTLTLIAEEAADKTTVEIISSGGKEGLAGFSYGAEKSALKRIVKRLMENGFTEL